MTYYTEFPSPIGKLTAVSNGQALLGLWIKGQKYFAAGLTAKPEENPADPVLCIAKVWLEAYFQGNRPDLAGLPLAPRGTSFQKTVWELLCQIPYGDTTTYGALAVDLAARMGKTSMSAQAVGQAVGRNPISIIIPCHRVLGMDGSLTGYAGGLEKKRFLLALEGITIP